MDVFHVFKIVQMVPNRPKHQNLLHKLRVKLKLVSEISFRSLEANAQ